MPPLTLSSYAAARGELLGRIHKNLAADPRFTAAWLTGSGGRGEADSVSDLDLLVVVREEFAGMLCRRQAPAAAGTTRTRLELFRRFGEPANIHENHNNALTGGTFSSVLYHQPPVIVDWTLAPQSSARRPALARLLFERAENPILAVSPGATGALPGADPLAERIAFFSMMAAVTAKYIVRGENGQANELIARLESTAREIEALAKQSPAMFAPGALPDRPAQTARARELMARVDELARMTGSANAPLPPVPRWEIEAILNLKE